MIRETEIAAASVLTPPVNTKTLFLDSADGEFKTKDESGTVASLKGDQGDPGATGDPGADGAGVPAGGTTGQILKKASGTDFDTEWDDEAAAGSGAMQKIATFTVSGTPASLDCLTRNEGSFTGDLFQSDFKRYVVLIHGLRTTAATTLLARISTDGSTFVSSGGAYAYGREIQFSSSTPANNTSATEMNWGVSDTLEDDATGPTNGHIWFYDPTSATAWKWMEGATTGRDNGGDPRSAKIYGTYKATTAMKGFQFLPGSSTLVNGGVVEVYGIA
jgi:hypothetical protein